MTCTFILVCTHTFTLYTVYKSAPLTHTLSCRTYIHTSIIHDELHHILYLFQGQPPLRTLPFITMGSGCYSSGEIAGFDGFKSAISNAMEEQKRLLADLHSLMVEDSVGLASLLPSV